MDRQTIGAYDRDAAVFARDWLDQPPPSDLHALALRYFGPGPTADVGCGAGRDTAWLNASGFAAVGYDASEGLLAEARRRYPTLVFEKAALPALSGVADGRFANVLCETVIIHLDPGLVGPAVRRLTDILAPGGTLYLSWRIGDGGRDGYGRLYAAFDASAVTAALGTAAVLLEEERTSASSGKAIHRIVARKG